MKTKTPHNGGASENHNQPNAEAVELLTQIDMRTVREAIEGRGIDHVRMADGRPLSPEQLAVFMTVRSVDLDTADEVLRDRMLCAEIEMHEVAPAASVHVLADDDRDTSRLAYEQAASADTGDTAQSILALLAEHGPLVDDDLLDLYLRSDCPPRSPQRIRTTRAELVRDGKVRQAGRGVSRYGNPARLWEVAA